MKAVHAHGQTRGQYTVKKWIQTAPNSGMYQEISICEIFCVRCGWIKAKGVKGALRWMKKHNDHTARVAPVEAEA